MTYMLAHRQFLKQQLYSLRMESMTMIKQLTEFNKILNGLVNNQDEDNTLLLLCTIPRSFEHFKDTMLYAKELAIPWRKSKKC
jgi:hypothetical protein